MSHLLRIATLNTWGIFYAPKHRHRLQAVAMTATRSAFDIIGLQEVWQDEEFGYIEHAAQTTGYNVHRFDDGHIGSGLVTLSRYPIVKTDFHLFQAAGRPETAYHGDYLADKGVGLTVIETPAGQVAFFNAHLIAQYTDDANDHYRAHRAAQMVEVAQFINRYTGTMPAILVGDLNTRPDQLGLRIIIEMASMRDAWATVHPDGAGYTFAVENPYVKDAESTRLDYIFSRDGGNQSITPQSVEVAFQMIDDLGVPYSDHYGVIAEFSVENDATTSEAKKQLTDSTRAELIDVLAKGRTDAQMRMTQHVQKAQTSAILTLIVQLLPRFIRRWIGVSSFIYAVAQGILAYFVRAEMHALKSIRDEVENM